MFDPGLQQHTIVTLTDPTVSAAQDGILFRNNAANGTTRSIVVVDGPFGPSVGNGPSATLKETSWFLGAYVHTLSLSPAPPAHTFR